MAAKSYDRKRRHAPDPNPTARIFENYALKSMDACAPSSSRLSSTIERNPKLVRYIISFHYIINSL
jgi:hypothetical protein